MARPRATSSARSHLMTTRSMTTSNVSTRSNVSRHSMTTRSQSRQNRFTANRSVPSVRNGINNRATRRRNTAPSGSVPVQPPRNAAPILQRQIEFIKAHGNDLFAKTWLGLWDAKRVHTQDQRELIIDKYERKRFYLEPASPLKSITNTAQLVTTQKQQLNSATLLTNGTAKSIEENNAIENQNNNNYNTFGYNNNSTNSNNNNNSTAFTQWSVWQQFPWPYIQPEQNRWSLPMSLSSTSNSLKSSGTFNSNSSINSTPSVDRYAALKDLDEQLREIKENTQSVATTPTTTATPQPANPFNVISSPSSVQNVQANPFQATSSPLWYSEQSIYPMTNGTTNGLYDQSAFGSNGAAIFNGNGMHHPKVTDTNMFNGSLNMANGFPQKNPFAAPNRC